jgi:outer membrane receptor protein involved in Fe transport
VGTLPQIPGVALHNVPPQINFGDGFHTFGCTAGINSRNITRRPTAITNDMLTWIRGKHQLKFGGEYRWIAGYVHGDGNQSGTFYFEDGGTGVPYAPDPRPACQVSKPPSDCLTQSGNSVASFLLEQVDSGNATFRAISSDYPRQHAYTWFVGDTWRLTPKLTVDYGIRWDEYSPFAEKWNRLSFFDPLGANPGAGGRPGRLAFAG